MELRAEMPVRLAATRSFARMEASSSCPPRPGSSSIPATACESRHRAVVDTDRRNQATLCEELSDRRANATYASLHLRMVAGSSACGEEVVGGSIVRVDARFVRRDALLARVGLPDGRPAPQQRHGRNPRLDHVAG